MNDILKTIYERRAVRRYLDTAVSKEQIDTLIDAGRMAPSAMNRQPWKFYVLTDRARIHDISKAITRQAAHEMKHHPVKDLLKTTLSFFHLTGVVDLLTGADMIFHGAPVVIFITSAVSDEWGGLDVGMCSQNMMLAAKSLGLDTCPVGFAQMVMKTDLYPTLQIPAAEKVELALIVGYGAEQPELHERKKNNVIYLS